MNEKKIKWTSNKKTLFTKLNTCNSRVEAGLRSLLSSSDSSYYANTISKCALLPSSQWSWLNTSADYSIDETIIQLLIEIRNAFESVRALLRDISNEAKVEIEPEEQTVLCDYTMNQPGVLLSGVPGAGGNDAIFAVVLDQSAIPSLEDAWRTWIDPANRKIQRLPVESSTTGIQTQATKNDISGWSIFI